MNLEYQMEVDDTNIFIIPLLIHNVLCVLMYAGVNIRIIHVIDSLTYI